MQKVVVVIIWLALVGSFIGYTLAMEQSLTTTLRDLVHWLESPVGPLVYVALYSLSSLMFFSSVVLALLGGAIWGPVYGTIYTIIGTNISATLAYVLGATLGHGMLNAPASTSPIARYVQRLRGNVFETVLMMRLVYVPYDLVNYLAGLLRVDYRAFILATLLGSLPGIVTFVLAGSSIKLMDILEGNIHQAVFNPWTLEASLVLFIASLVLSRWLKQRERKDGAIKRGVMGTQQTDVVAPGAADGSREACSLAAKTGDYE